MLIPGAYDPIPVVASGISSELLTAWIAAVAAVVTALVAAAFGWVQQRRAHRHARELEREKLALEDRLARKRTEWEDSKRAEAERAKAEERLRAEAAHADARQRQATDYRRKVIERLRHMKILDMSKPLDLDELYVQLRVREEEPLRYATEAEIAELSRGEPERLLRLSQERLRAGAAVAVSPGDALERFRRFVALGDPGAGKTTMLHHLTLQIAREEQASGLTLPVYVELRDFVDSVFFEAEGTDLFAYMVDDLRRCYGFADAQPYLEQELAAGRAALLLDGLDEVLGGAGPESADAAYRKVAAEVERLATRYPNAPIVVTCRRAGWRGGLSQFQTLEVLDFDWPQVQAFVSRWYADDPAKADALRETLAASLRMQTLAANPLLLSLIAIVYGRDLELPERRAELYHRCVDVLLKDWDAHRGIRRFAQFTADRKRDLLEEVAWHFHRTGRRYFAERELLELIEAFLPTIDLDAGHARAILDEIAAQYGLLKVQAHGWYGFLHLTLQEYFAAVAANERGRAAVAEVAAHRHDPWWEEVILLLAGRMADASPLLLALLGRDPDPHAVEPPRDEPLSADDDLFHGDLFLVTRCLVGVPRLRTPWLRARIMATVRDLLLGSPCRTVSERAARRLVEVGGAALRDELLSLVADEDVPIERRKAIVAAFGALGDTAAAPRLFAIMERHGRPGPITSDLVLALGGIGYTPALPTSLRWLRDVMDSADPDPDAVLEAWVVVQVVSVLSDSAAKPALWRLVEHATLVIATEKAAFDKAGGTSACIRGSVGTGRGWVCFRILNDLVTVIGQVGDEEDIDPLFDLCRRGLADGAGASAIIALGGDAEARRLFDMLAAPDIDSQLFLGILRELRNLKSGRIAPRALTTLRDPGVPWQIRWHITELFDGCLPEACEATLARLLSDEELDHRVKIGIAATLALGDDPAGVDHLRRGFDRETLPDALLSEHNGSLLAAGGTWKRVADALRHVEDTSVVPALRVRHQRALEAGDTELALDLDTALRHLLPAEFDRRQQWLATCSEGGQYAFADRVTPSMLPSAFHVIDVRRAKGWDTTDLIRKVGEIADDAWSAERLLQIVLSGPPVSHARDAEQAYNALDEVCRRARVRAFPNGRIVPVRG